MELYVNIKDISKLVDKQANTLGKICDDNKESSGWISWIKHPIAKTRAEMLKRFTSELMGLYKHAISDSTINKNYEDNL